MSALGPRPLYHENAPPHSHAQRRSEARRLSRRPKASPDFTTLVQKTETLHLAWDREDDFSRDLDEFASTARRIHDEEDVP